MKTIAHPKSIAVIAAAISLLGATAMADFRGRGHDRDSNEWVMIGQTSISHRLDRDMIPVDSREDYGKIAFRVDGPTVHFYDCKVHFRNGQVQEMPLNLDLRSGEMTAPIDLGRNHERHIRGVTLTAETRGHRGEGTVTIFARN